MTRIRFLVPIFALVALLFTAAPLMAGGWATVELDGPPAGVLRSGSPVRVGFTVLQHGQTPVHTANIMNDQPIIPVVVAVNQATAESVTAFGWADAEVGHFSAELILPSAGTWAWSIVVPPFEGKTAFEPLVIAGPALAPEVADPVLGAAQVAPRASTSVTAGFPPGLTLLAVVLLGAVVVAASRRPAAPAGEG